MSENDLASKHEAEDLETSVEWGELCARHIAMSRVLLSRLPMLPTLYSILIPQKPGKRIVPIDRN